MATRDRIERVTDGTTSDGDEERSRPGLTLVAGAVAAAVLSPVAWLLLRASEVGLGQAVELVARPTAVQVLVNSLLLVVLVTAGSVALGVPLAVLTVRANLPFGRVWTVLLALPLVIPSYIGAFAYVSAFGPRGVLADALAPLGIERIPAIYGLEGTVLVLTLFVYPYVFLTTRASLLTFDDSLVEAARTLGDTRREAFRRVVLPRILPGITAGALLVALYALSDFGTPAIMHYDVFTRTIYVEYSNFGRDTAALLSLELLAVTAVVLAVESRVGDDEGARASRGIQRVGNWSLGGWTLPAMGLCLLVVALSLGVPLGVLFMWLGRSGTTYGSSAFAFQWSYGVNSAYVSALAALVSTLAALPVAYLAARSNSRLANLFERATYVGYAMPGIVLGLALVYFGATHVRAVYQTLPLLVFAYVVRFLPQAVGATRSSVLQVDPRLTDAARTLGSSSLGAFRRVTLPLIAPGVVAGAALVFLTTMKELPATLLLHPTGFRTLVTYIWEVQEAGYFGRAALPALALVAISAVSMVALLTQEGKDVT